MSAVALERRSRPAGWWGMAIFVATEATLFGTLFGTYVYLRFRVAHWPPEGIPAPSVTVPLVLAAVLVATSVPIQLAVRAARGAHAAAARRLVFLALFVQAGYFAMQIQLFTDDLAKFSPRGSAYASISYTLLGAHHLHVAVGMLLSLWIGLRLLGGLTRYRLVGLEAIALYWHFVNVLALCVVLTVLSPSL
jgi:heme/copper-type cytochrome/quinol oxidase subunit 3